MGLNMSGFKCLFMRMFDVRTTMGVCECVCAGALAYSMEW